MGVCMAGNGKELVVFSIYESEDLTLSIQEIMQTRFILCEERGGISTHGVGNLHYSHS